MSEIQQKYNLEALQRRIPDDRAEVFLGFRPWEEDLAGWNRSVSQQLTETAARSVLRTIWENPDNRNTRLLIDVIECPSATEAIRALADRLEWNQLAQVPEGPPELGDAAFMHPQGIPPAVFFARGNLCISVASFGSQQTAVIPWAERLNRRLGARPAVERMTISLTADPSTPSVGEEVIITYSLPWKQGEGAYLTFFVVGGTMSRREGRLIFKGIRPGEATIDAFLLEPGRETYAGHLALNLK